MINACEGTARHFFHVTDIILSAYSVRKKITDQDSGHCKRPNLDFMHVSTDLNYMLAGHVRQGCIPGSNTASNPWYPCATSHRIKDHIDNGRHHLSTFTMHWWLAMEQLWSNSGRILEEFADSLEPAVSTCRMICRGLECHRAQHAFRSGNSRFRGQGAYGVQAMWQPLMTLSTFAEPSPDLTTATHVGTIF